MSSSTAALALSSAMQKTAGLCQSAVRVGDCSGMYPMLPAPAPWWYLNPAHMPTAWGPPAFNVASTSSYTQGPCAVQFPPVVTTWSMPQTPAPPGPSSARAARAFLFSRLDGGFPRRLSGSNRTSQARSAPPVSKTSDKEHTAASLGHSEELRVQNSPCETVPEVIHFCEELPESRPALARERSRDVLPDKPSRTELTNAAYVLEHESRCASEPLALSGD